MIAMMSFLYLIGITKLESENNNNNNNSIDNDTTNNETNVVMEILVFV